LVPRTIDRAAQQHEAGGDKSNSEEPIQVFRETRIDI